MRKYANGVARMIVPSKDERHRERAHERAASFVTFSLTTMKLLRWNVNFRICNYLPAISRYIELYSLSLLRETKVRTRVRSGFAVIRRAKRRIRLLRQGRRRARFSLYCLNVVLGARSQSCMRKLFSLLTRRGGTYYAAF